MGDDGRLLVEFFAAIVRADHKYLDERRIVLRDRMEAARWLADRAFGKPQQTVEIADIEREQRVAAL